MIKQEQTVNSLKDYSEWIGNQKQEGGSICGGKSMKLGVRKPKPFFFLSIRRLLDFGPSYEVY